jgi:hypothetical protein
LLSGQLGTFAAHVSASPAHVAHAVIAVAGSFANADDAFNYFVILGRVLCTLKDLGNPIRDCHFRWLLILQ